MCGAVSDHCVSDLALNAARQSLYRFASLTLVDPRSGSWEVLDTLRDGHLLTDVCSLIRNVVDSSPLDLGPGERPVLDLNPQQVLDLLPHYRQAFEAAYEGTFGLLVSNACPPYETEYVNNKFAFQRSNALADVSGFYKAFGLAISREHPERHDHIALELEYMAFLLGLERRAREGISPHRDEHLDVCRAAQARFLKEHLAWWVPAFTRLLACEDPGGFYEAVANFLGALIPAERALLGVVLQWTTASTSQEERPDECEGCQFEF
jgi:TorA maturation chaperone TorD